MKVSWGERSGSVGGEVAEGEGESRMRASCACCLERAESRQNHDPSGTAAKVRMGLRCAQTVALYCPLLLRPLLLLLPLNRRHLVPVCWWGFQLEHGTEGEREKSEK